ncbi:hypothetical protein MMC25_006541 [Agyrium rufum]|nr:hypothetical protein [Agyrium rufum]
MADDKELLSRISQVAGHINLYKSQTPPAAENVNPNRPGNNYVQRTSSHQSSWPSNRGSPYQRPSYGGRRNAANPHRNRTLILNQKAASANTDIAPTALINIADDDVTKGGTGDHHKDPTAGWISKQDRHKQLINKAVFDERTQLRTKAIEDTRRRKMLEHQKKEQQKLFAYAQLPASRGAFQNSNTALPEIQVEGLWFQITRGGNKLVRILSRWSSWILWSGRAGSSEGRTEPEDKHRSTPKTTRVAGVKFVRSTNGNLYRNGLVNAKRGNVVTKKKELCQQFTSTGTMSNEPPFLLISHIALSLTVWSRPYTSSCIKGPKCRYTHDPLRVAICPSYLMTGTCLNGSASSCDLSHETTPERVPTCQYFFRGKCTKGDCRYAHVKTSPSALDKHVHECPDYSNTGLCKRKKCSLPHVDRAGQIRRQAEAAAVAAATSRAERNSGEEEDSEEERDLESDEEEEEDEYMMGNHEDVDSDGLADDFIPLVVYSLIIISKAGGLIYQRDFHEGLNKLSVNDYLVLAGTFHGVHAITRSLTPAALLPPPQTNPTPNRPLSSSATATIASTLNGASNNIPTRTQTPQSLLSIPQQQQTSLTNPPHPLTPLPHQLSGLEVLETALFRLTCFQTYTGIKFLLFTEPQQPNVDATVRKVYELYADYVMKNPFYQLEMPVRCEGFERGLAGLFVGSR